MKKYNLEITIFIVNAIYMILELIASRILSPFFGNSNMVWTSVIGIILLSSSAGNYLGGIIADKRSSKANIKIILVISGILIMIIPFIQSIILYFITSTINSIKLGAIIATIALFFIPSMFIGMLSPIILKLKMENLEKVGKTSGIISAISTLGSITGTFLGGFFLIPSFGCNQILFVLAIIMFLLVFLVDNEKLITKSNVFIIIAILICSSFFYMYTKSNKLDGKKVLEGELNTSVSYDTEYGRVLIYNTYKGPDLCRCLNIDKGNESATYVDEEKCYDLVYEYTKFYNLMFESSNEIKDVLMIGGAGYSYPKFYISNYLDKNMDVVEIDGKVTEIAKEYFFLDKLIEEFDLENTNRLNLITDDGRVFINQNTKKYDAILNDAFAGESPAETLTTLEAIQKIYSSLNEDGLYMTNIISSLDGANSNFIKAEVHTLQQVFENVYVVPCNDISNVELVQNNMVIATDDDLMLDNAVKIDCSNAVLLTDNYCPIDSLVPQQ